MSPTILCLRRIAAYETSMSPQPQCSARSVRGTCLHSITRSQNLSVIGAIERAYSRHTFGMTATSRNASKVSSAGTAHH